jgi:MFS family permease
LRYRDFRLIWATELLSQTGTQVQRVAVAWQVFELTGDPLQLGLLGLARFFPLLIFGIAGGVVADRYDRRTILILSQIGLTSVAATFAALTASGAITIVWIYGLTALSAIFSAVSTPTRHALIPTLVPAAMMPAAMTMGVLAMQGAGMVGPALGGTLIATTGLVIAYAIDAVTYALVGVAAVAIRARPERPVVRASGLAAAIEGLRFLRDSPVLLATMLLDFVANFFGASTTLMPFFAADILGGGAATLGWLLSAPAVGAVSGATVMASRRPLDRPGVGILGAVVVYGASLTAFALSRNLWLSLALLAVSGAADAVSVSQRHTLRNLVTPDRLRGRVSAAHSTFAGGGPQLGEFEAGVVASWTGAATAVAIGGIGTVLSALIVARRVPEILALRWDATAPADEPTRPAIGAPAARSRIDE